MSANGATKRDLFRVISERDATISALQSENERLKETALTPTQADWILAETEGWPEEINNRLIAIVESRRISLTSEETS